jgi:glycosyltransferase involved in cell wall biosynthesis
MRRVLIIAYYFPPIGGIGSIRMARFTTYLPELGWEPTVIAPRDTPHQLDPDLSFPEHAVIRSRSIELSRLGRGLPTAPAARGADAARRGGRVRASVRAAAHRYVFYPDAQIGWYPGAVRAGLRALRREQFDAIYSSSFPITAHLVARTLSRRSGLPWVAEFRDPWSDRLEDRHPHRDRASRLEASIAGDAAKLVAPSPSWAELFGARWGKRVETVPNGHDVATAPQPTPGRPTLTHLGTYYPGEQSFQALWAALGELVRAGPPDAPVVRFVGDLPEKVREEIETVGLGDHLEATGLVSHDDALRAMLSSTMLIASGSPVKDPVSRGWIPAKLFEYLGSGLPILYLGDPAGDAGRLLLGQPGCYVVEPTDVSGVRAALEAGLAGQLHDRDTERFSRRARTRALAEVLDQAVEITGR